MKTQNLFSRIMVGAVIITALTVLGGCPNIFSALGGSGSGGGGGGSGGGNNGGKVNGTVTRDMSNKDPSNAAEKAEIVSALQTPNSKVPMPNDPLSLDGPLNLNNVEIDGGKIDSNGKTITITGNTTLNGTDLEVDNSGKLEVAKDVTVTLDGAGTKLDVTDQSELKVGTGGKVIIENGATLEIGGAAGTIDFEGEVVIENGGILIVPAGFENEHFGNGTITIKKGATIKIDTTEIVGGTTPIFELPNATSSLVMKETSMTVKGGVTMNKDYQVGGGHTFIVTNTLTIGSSATLYLFDGDDSLTDGAILQINGNIAGTDDSSKISWVLMYSSGNNPNVSGTASGALTTGEKTSSGGVKWDSSDWVTQ